MPVVSVRVRRQQPAHPTPQVPIPLGSYDQVEVVGHEAVAEDVERDPVRRVVDGLDERVVVGRLVEDRLAAVAAIQGMVDHASYTEARAVRGMLGG